MADEGQNTLLILWNIGQAVAKGPLRPSCAFRACRPADEISFAEVIRAIDGPLALAPCASVTAYRRCGDCVDEETCAIRKVLLAARHATASGLETRMISEVFRKRRPPQNVRARAAVAAG